MMDNQQPMFSTATPAAAVPTCFRPVAKYTTAATFSLAKLMPVPAPAKVIHAMDVVQHPLEEHLFACATTDHRISVIDFNKGVTVNQYPGHDDRINELCFTGINEDKDLGNVFFSASEDGFIKIWDSRTSSMVSSIRIKLFWEEQLQKINNHNSYRESTVLCCL